MSLSQSFLFQEIARPLALAKTHDAVTDFFFCHATFSPPVKPLKYIPIPKLTSRSAILLIQATPISYWIIATAS